ncbi:MAG: glycoside hydrolase family 3 N-terminal domain-containing protein [Bacteroidota bacterium]
MKNTFAHVMTLFLLLSSAALVNLNAQTENKKIDDLIRQMTVEEKVGQMTNIAIGMVLTEKGNSNVLDREKLRSVMIEHHVGSFQNVVNHAYTLDQWHALIDTIQKINMEESRLKIPVLYAIDAVHGANYTIGSTIFPHNLGLAATRNLELAKVSAEVTAKEVRASGIRYNFSPVLDAGRHPLWPRMAETFGEDIFLVKQMGLSVIEGYEGKDLKDVRSVASCMKHYIGYSVPTSGKDRAPALIPEIMLREYFLPSFKAAVEKGAATVMVNSAEINGEPVHASKYLLTNVLRDELGFKGVVISDWEDVKKLMTRHHVASTYKEAVFQSVMAGIDLCIVPMDLDFSRNLVELVNEGRIPQSRIDASVRRILKMKLDVGLFDRPYVETEAAKNFGLQEYSKTAFDAASESITLLKNTNGLLPISKDKKILVVGPGAASLTTLYGAWSYTWQGTKDEYFNKDLPSIVQAIKARSKNVTYNKGTDFSANDVGIAKAVAIAKSADVIVVCLGEDSYAETPGNIEDLDLPEIQQRLVLSLSKTRKPIIAVLTEGRPRVIREIEPLCNSILLAYWPGSQGGNAIAGTIFGEVNPSGKLPVTYPRYSGSFSTYDHKYLEEAVEKVDPYEYSFGFNPQYEFGFGLSYTTFSMSEMTFSTDTVTRKSPITVKVTVKNTGTMAGKETIELFSADLVASVTPSVKRLRKFQKTPLLVPGESKTLEFILSSEDLAFVGKDLKMITEEGEFDIVIGKEKKRIYFKN